MADDIKQIIIKEYLKCSNDPTHFLKKYCFIQHPQRGRILLNLFPFQEKLIRVIHVDGSYTIINKGRQLGISTITAGEALHFMLFNKDKNVLCIATKQETARNMIEKVRFMYDNLPSWLQTKTTEFNKLSIRFSNGSQIKASTASTDAGRSEAVSLLIIDEAAFIDKINPIWASAQQTLALGGRCIVISTPNGVGNWFHKTYTAAEAGDKDNKFVAIRLPWHVHPERDDAWRKEQDIKLGDPRIAAQELDCDFSTSGDTVFHPDWIKYIREMTIRDPLERRGLDGNLWVWEPADYSKEYMVIADVARGDGKDYSTAHVIEIETNIQVAEYRGKLSTKEFGYFLVGLATEYNNALLIVENSSVGWATLDSIIEREYKNLYHSPRSNKLISDSYLQSYEGGQDMVPGFTMSQKTRPLIINKLREFIREKAVIIQSRRTLEEMIVFIWKNGRPEAQTGYNDDLVIALAIGMFLRDTSFRFQQQSLDMARASLENISSNKVTYRGGYTNEVPNPYEWDIGLENKENLNWLL